VGVAAGILLDTHAFVWAVTDPKRLGTNALALIQDPATDMYVSAASAWEIATKARLGKFPQAEPIHAQFNELVERLRATPLAITATHALAAGAMRWEHRDPFDRMLAAQAISGGLTLVTRDQQLRDLAALSTAW